jgi:hypothetical protein
MAVEIIPARSHVRHKNVAAPQLGELWGHVT